MNASRWWGVAGLALCLASGSCEASTVFSTDFNAETGTVYATTHSERGDGLLLRPFSVTGWTTLGDASQVCGFESGGDKALMLNECGSTPNGISRVLTGLLPGVQHTLSFDHWGDDQGLAYSFDFEVNGVLTHVSQNHAGLSSGVFHTRTFQFTPTTTSTLLRFVETSTGTESPILDNISVTAADPGVTETVPEPASLALFSAGALGMLGFLRTRRK